MVGELNRQFVNLTPEQREREASLIGYRWQHLPGMPSDHQVMGFDSAGDVIRVQEIERTFNYCYMIDFVLGPGTFGKNTGARQEDVLALAIELYSAAVDQEGPARVQ